MAEEDDQTYPQDNHCDDDMLASGGAEAEVEFHPDEGWFEDSGSDTEGFLPLSWSMDLSAITQLLAQLGLVDTKLAQQAGEEGLLLEQLLSRLGIDPSAKERSWLSEHLVNMINTAVLLEPLSKRVKGDYAGGFIPNILDSIGTFDAQHKLALSTLERLSMEKAYLEVPLKGSRNRVRRASVAIVGSREQEEEEQKNFWSREALKLLTDIAAPVLELSKESSNPTAILMGALGSTRPGTMKLYINAWKKFSSWYAFSAGHGWPSTIVTWVDFLHCCKTAPCAPTFPKVFSQAAAWIEKVGGFQGDDKWTEHPLFRQTVSHCSEALHKGVSPLKQAPRLPAAILISLEFYVCNESRPLGRRWKAFCILLKCWASLREDDLQHLSPTKIRIAGELLLNELLRTKTSGGGKRIRELPVAVWVGAGVTTLPWIEKGLVLLDSLGIKSGDYMLRRTSPDGIKIYPEPASYSNSSAQTGALMADLKEVAWVDDQWKETDKQLVPFTLHHFWTEHSPRNLLPSILIQLDVEKSRRDLVGRWSPTGADDYARTYRSVVRRLQEITTVAFRSSDKRLEESDVLDRMSTFLTDKTGMEEDWVRDQVSDFKVTLSRAWVSLKKAQETEYGIIPSSEAGLGEEVLLSQIASVSAPIPALQSLKKIREAKPSRFVIVYGRRRKFGRLHRLGGSCPWPYLQVADSLEVEVAEPRMYNSRCKICWPKLTEISAGDEMTSSDSEQDC